MVAYNFKERFESLLLSGAKTQTIRALGKRRHASPGDMVQGYVGQRTRSCRKIFEQPCIEQKSVSMRWEEWGRIAEFCVFVNDQRLTNCQLNALAVADGFDGIKEMMQFFAPRLPFDGVLIKWEPPAV